MALLFYIRRFGWKRGIEFRRVAARCGKDVCLLSSWAAHYRALASHESRHGHRAEGRTLASFAEILQATYDKLVGAKRRVRP